MKRIIVALCLLSCMLIPISTADEQNSDYWEIDLDNGYISTKPIIVDNQVIVRTSGFWTGEDRPHVYAFDLYTGQENWRFKNTASTNHDMSPIMHVEAGTGDCGDWSEMVIIGWTDGKVTALDIEDGSLVWSSQTEVVTWGITGAMALDGDDVVVPTRQGLSRFCLSDGNENLRVDLPQLGWRNGVTVTNDSYLIGNEEGVVNIVSKSGNVTNISIGDGKIRHAPIQTDAGIIVHLQKDGGSGIYLGEQLLSEEGYSPAIPYQKADDIFFATSEHVIWWKCESNCTFQGRTAFHSNGEITLQENQNSTSVWYPGNTPDGGWATGLPGQELEMYATSHDTYTTAGIGFGTNGEMALGNDAGVLMVILDSSENTPIVDGREEFESESEDSSFQVEPEHFVLVGLVASILVFQYRKDSAMVIKLGVLLVLVISIIALPSISEVWSKEVDELTEAPGDWDDGWPSEWEGTQVVVFELPSGEVAIGGLEGHENVEQLTESAAIQLGIQIEKETFSLGEMIVSFNGQELDGWEFTIDGERSQVGISSAEVAEASVVRWSPA
tara:strand:- start:1414 stop:3078 length:1665 start_codon:yes stop_codon:yes gene_type:complete